MYDKVATDFFNKNKIPLEEAIARFNRKWNAVDVDFLKTALEDEDFSFAALEQIKEIEDSLASTLLARDNFVVRVVDKAIKELPVSKKISDDTRVSQRVINKNKCIQNILNYKHKLNPLAELNWQVYGSDSFESVFIFNKEFYKTNKEYLVYTKSSSGNITNIKIPFNNVDKITITENMIVDLDLKQYPFFLWWEIQNNNFDILVSE